MAAEADFTDAPTPNEYGLRQSAAVAIADIVGYSMLMSTESEATHSRWMKLFNGALKPLAWKHGSTFLKSSGRWRCCAVYNCFRRLGLG